MKRITTRHRRFQLSMQAWFCICWLNNQPTIYGLRREIVLEYAALAQWRSGIFRV